MLNAKEARQRTIEVKEHQQQMELQEMQSYVDTTVRETVEKAIEQGSYGCMVVCPDMATRDYIASTLRIFGYTVNTGSRNRLLLNIGWGAN